MRKATVVDIQERLLEKRPAGLSIDVVLADRGTGLRQALARMQRETQLDGKTRVLSLSGAFGGFDLLEFLTEIGDGKGRSMTRRMAATLRNLSDNGKRSLSFIANDAQYIEIKYLELIVDALQHAAASEHIELYLCLVFKKSDHYRRAANNPREWIAAYDYPRLPILYCDLFDAKRLRLLALKKDGIEPMTRAEARETMNELIAKAS